MLGRAFYGRSLNGGGGGGGTVDPKKAHPEQKLHTLKINGEHEIRSIIYQP